MSSTSHTSRLLPGQRLYKYELRRRIGVGSFGEVWLAFDHTIHHEYAIKILAPGATIHESLREARVGHQLNHPNLVRVHQADVVKLGQHRIVILAMDYIEDGRDSTFL